jgi:xanthine dehydrogenase YagR molybdenum-binding subunit
MPRVASQAPNHRSETWAVTIEVEFVVRPDPLLNSLGIKGLGEVAMTGVAPAIVNAIHYATGRRLWDLPIRIEQPL